MIGRTSRSQRHRRRELAEQLHLGVFPSGQGVFPSGSYRQTETTKETGYRLSPEQIREGSSSREAAPSRSSQTKSTSPQARRGDLLAAARATFPTHATFPNRAKLFSVDVFGRRSEIDTSRMGAGAYQKLLESFQSPIRFDDPSYKLTEFPEPEHMVFKGCKLGPETQLPILDWWQIPELGASVDEIKAILKDNLHKARERRDGRGWRRAL